MSRYKIISINIIDTIRDILDKEIDPAEWCKRDAELLIILGKRIESAIDEMRNENNKTNKQK